MTDPLDIPVDAANLTLGQIAASNPQHKLVFLNELPLFLNCYQGLRPTDYWALTFAEYGPLKEFVAALMSQEGSDG